MAIKTHRMFPGEQYRIKAGMFTGDVVTILDNVTVPDGQPNARKLKVQHFEGEMYILPRQLESEPVVPIAALIAEAPTADVLYADEIDSEEQVTQRFEVVTTKPILVVETPLNDPMDPRLDHLRPSRERLAQYVSRTMPNGMSDTDFLLSFTEQQYRDKHEGYSANIMLKGDTQSGKTILVDVLAILWADRLGYPKPMPVFTLSGSNGITDFDLFGQPTSHTNPETGVDRLVFLHGVVDLAARCGGILYLDECNAINERTTTSVHPLTDSRHSFTNRAKAVERGGLHFPEVVTAHKHLWCVGTYNDGGYRGMSDMNEAFLNRFRHLTWGYNSQVEEKLITSPAIRLLGDYLRTAYGKKVLRTPVGTSALQNCVMDCYQFGPEMGLSIFMGLFKSGAERLQVEEIINAQSIIVKFNEELKVNT